MTKCYQNTIRFSSVQRRKVEDEFSGGAITGNEDIPLLRGGGPTLGSDVLGIEVLWGCTASRAVGASTVCRILLRQRVYALALGHEDLNDHEELRDDPALQTETSRTETLAILSTLCRLKQRTTGRLRWRCIRRCSSRS